MAGTSILLLKNPNDPDERARVEEDVMQDYTKIMKFNDDMESEGVLVQASTLGSLEALLEFLSTCKIPVSGVSIGPVHKKDVMRAGSQLERAKQYAVILAFDVPVEPAAAEIAQSMGVKIMTANIIYHLFDQFTAYMNSIREAARQEASATAVFPCVLRVIPQYVFNKKDPLVLGVDVVDGILKIGTPIVVPQKDNLYIGKVTSIEHDHKARQMAKVCGGRAGG